MEKMTANMYVISNLVMISPESTVFDAYEKMQKAQIEMGLFLRISFYQ